MLAVDTNIVIRYVTRDHPEQSPRAKAIVDGHDVFVTTTVLLECEWVLRSTYRYDRRQVTEAIGGFVGLPTVTLEDPVVAARALEWAGQGVDFADALHLAGARGCEAFVSFDQRLAAAANSIADVPVREP